MSVTLVTVDFTADTAKSLYSFTEGYWRVYGLNYLNSDGYVGSDDTVTNSNGVVVADLPPVLEFFSEGSTEIWVYPTISVNVNLLLAYSPSAG
jgi:hypothetical protein